MVNPWLQVPLAEYEGHMSSPAVRQTGALAEIFAEILRNRAPREVILLGVAGGNGLNRIDSATTRRIVGVDINPEYLAAARERYAQLQGLELHRADLAAERPAIAPADLVHAALIFEHAGTELCLENAMSFVAPGGALSVVLQLPSTSDAGVGTSTYASVQKFKDHFQLIPPEEFAAKVQAHGFSLASERRQPLVSGKAFWIGLFEKQQS